MKEARGRLDGSGRPESEARRGLARKWQPRERRARSQRQTAIFPKEPASNGVNEMLQQRWHGGALWIARRESQLKSGPRETVGINPSRQHGSTESRRKRGGGSSINQCSFSRSSRGELIVRVLQRSDARQSARDVLIPTWRLNSTMRIAMGCCETVVPGIPKPRTAMGSCVLSGEHAFRRAGGYVRRV